MKKLFMLLVCLSLSLPLFAADTWEKGTGEAVPLGTESPSDLDTLINYYISDPLELLLANYRQGARLTYASSSTLTITAGEVSVSNTGGTIRGFCSNSASVTMAWSDIDTGAEEASTRYYLFAVCADPTADEPEFTVKCSKSSSLPTGSTYYKRLGNFYNDASSNISDIQNDGFFADLGSWETKTNGVTYQAMTDGFCIANSDTYGIGYFYTDSSSSPTTVRWLDYAAVGHGHFCTAMGFAKKGDYWKTADVANVYWIPLE